MLYVQPNKAKSFDSLQELKVACAEEERTTEYIPVESFSGNYFEDDCTIAGRTFNESGMKEFLGRLGAGAGLYQTLQVVDRRGLASQVVNDLLAQDHAQAALASARFVIQESTIIGMVGSRYESFPNMRLIEAIENGTNLDFKEARLSNTMLTLRAYDTLEGLEMKSHGQEGKDFIRFGCEFRNDMTGKAAIQGSVVTERMLCTNQMVHRTRSAEFRRIHVGDAAHLQDRMSEIITLTKDEYEVIGDKFRELAVIGFNPITLAALGAPVDLLPELRKEKLFKPYHSIQGNERARAIIEASEIIKAIPDTYGGVHTKQVWNSPYRDRKVMFDFCETYTEAAQSSDYSSEVRHQIEEDAGTLTDWIVKNRQRIEEFQLAA